MENTLSSQPLKDQSLNDQSLEGQSFNDQSPHSHWAAHSNLTPAQRPLWLGQKLSPDSPLYNMAFLFTFSGKIDPDHFQAAFQGLLQRCDALRTVIEETAGIPQQRVLSELNYTVPVLDFQAEPDAQTAVQTWGHARSQRLFDLTKQLFDTVLIQCSPTCTVWYLNQHHLITDMVSLKQLYEVMGDLYARSLAGTLVEAPALPAYADVELPTPAARATDYWQAQQFSPAALYHRTHLSTASESASHRISCALSPEQTKALKKLSLNSAAAAFTPQLSLFNLVAGLVLAYLFRISDSEQVAFATPAQGRPSAALKKTIGVFIELFPLGVSVEPDETFESLLAKVTEASGHLLRYAQPGASEFAAHRDVNVVLNFLTAKVSDFAGHPVRAQWLHAGASDPHHDLRILVHDFDDRGYLQLHFDFNDALFDPALQKRGPAHFLALVDAAIAGHTQPIANVNLLSDTEQQQLKALEQSQPLSITQTVVEQFEAQVQETPEAIAIISKPLPAESTTDKTLTYQQLNAKANQLAHLLVAQGITPEAPIALYVHRSIEMLVAIWGVLKAGGTYVPLDPSHPPTRLAHSLADTLSQWVLTHSTLTSQLTEGVSNNNLSNKTSVLALDTLNLDTQPNNNLPSSPELNQRAYCLYTSGSTGEPKGVEIEHSSLANYTQWAEQHYVRGRKFAFPLFTPLTFDLTVTSIYVPLISGGQVVIYPENTGTHNNTPSIDLSLQRIFQDNAVDIIKLTPSHLGLVQGIPVGSRVSALILGGEDLKTSLAQTITQGTAIELYNEYGPTEATVGCMTERYLLQNDSQISPASTPVSVPIGVPAAGAEITLRDKHLNKVPLGDVGEIYIGGAGLARGYLNQPELTAERFVMKNGQRLYRTGDLGRWEETGKLSYLGRCDRQVKLRGIRVELGEIEAAIAAHPSVTNCVVTLTKLADKQQLVAYYTTASSPTHLAPSLSSLALNELSDDLKTFIRQRLPLNVRPTHFVALTELPLTRNGKVDIHALPDPTAEGNNNYNTFAPPQSDTEKTLANIWQQVLSVQPIGLHDNFFDLGGDSILAIQIAARLTDAGITVSPNQLFQQATIAELAAELTNDEKAKVEEANSRASAEGAKGTKIDATDSPNRSEFHLPEISSGQMDKLSALLNKADKSGEKR
ncbi:MAG: amino acid adenylation domain-containing protein [Cyanobacteria bacterium J06634_5]